MRETRRRVPFGTGIVVALLAAVAAFALTTWNVQAVTQADFGDGVAAGPAPCGNAYDVVLNKGGDGFVGGDTPRNQDTLDAECTRIAGRMLVAGGVSGGLAVGILLTLAVVAVGDRSRRRATASVEALV